MDIFRQKNSVEKKKKCFWVSKYRSSRLGLSSLCFLGFFATMTEPAFVNRSSATRNEVEKETPKYVSSSTSTRRKEDEGKEEPVVNRYGYVSKSQQVEKETPKYVVSSTSSGSGSKPAFVSRASSSVPTPASTSKPTSNGTPASASRSSSVYSGKEVEKETPKYVVSSTSSGSGNKPAFVTRASSSVPTSKPTSNGTSASASRSSSVYSGKEVEKENISSSTSSGSGNKPAFVTRASSSVPTSKPTSNGTSASASRSSSVYSGKEVEKETPKYVVSSTSSGSGNKPLFVNQASSSVPTPAPTSSEVNGSNEADKKPPLPARSTNGMETTEEETEVVGKIEVLAPENKIVSVCEWDAYQKEITSLRTEVANLRELVMQLAGGEGIRTGGEGITLAPPPPKPLKIFFQDNPPYSGFLSDLEKLTETRWETVSSVKADEWIFYCVFVSTRLGAQVEEEIFAKKFRG